MKESRGAIATCADPNLPSKEKIRISRNWTKCRYEEATLLAHNVRYMPRLQLDGETLWASWGSRIWAHERKPDGTIHRQTKRVLSSHRDDVSTFVVKDGLVVSGGRDRSFVAWEADTGRFLFARRYCHKQEISGVDLVSRHDNRRVVVTGSHDGSLRFWAFDLGANNNSQRCVWMAQSLAVEDRIYALSASPSGDRVIVGSAGLTSGVPSVHAVDTATNTILPLGAGQLKRGAGTLDLAWHSPNTFLSCGHDTAARLWDARTGDCVRTWEEPFDDAVYCLSTDYDMTLLCGMARHGLVRLWDMRATQPVAFYHSRHAQRWQSSPVYSIASDSKGAYVALDQCLNLLSFAGYGVSGWGETKKHTADEEIMNQRASVEKIRNNHL